MKRILIIAFLILLIPAVGWGQHWAFMGGQQASCDCVGTADFINEPFESNSGASIFCMPNPSWDTKGNLKIAGNTSYQTTGHPEKITSCYHLRIVSPSAGDYFISPNNATATKFMSVWFKFSDTTKIRNLSGITIFAFETTAGSLAGSISLQSADDAPNGTSIFACAYYTGAASKSASNTLGKIAVTANTWYHLGMSYEELGVDRFSWYVGTQKTFSASDLIYQDAAANMARQFNRLAFGRYSTVLTITAPGNLDFDDLFCDTTGFKYD